MIIRLSTLTLYISCNHFFASMLSDCVHKVTLPPEFPTPKFSLHLGGSRKYFPSRHAFHLLHHARRTISRHGLDQEMRMIPIYSYFKKVNLPTLLNFKTYFLEQLIDTSAHHNTTILGRTNKMIHQY